MKCQHPGCNGTVEDGFCDVCGRAPQAVSGTTSNGTVGTATHSRRTTTSLSSTSSSSTTSRRRAGLGAGLVDLPPVASFDPLQAVLTDTRVPERRRVCSAQVYRAPNSDLLSQPEALARGIPPEALEDCGAKLNNDSGFCPACGQEYTFVPSLRPGDVVDRKYEVKGPVAFGGFGWIYLAWARHLARWVIIKGLLNIKDRTLRELARTEARSLSAFKHPNIVQVYDLIEGDPSRGEPDYIVMEYVGGRTLMQIRRERGPLPVAEACAYVLGILPAFQYIHQQGRVYMDFKPENGMLEGAAGGESERIVLIDMGAVHQAFAEDPSAGALYATVGYSSPEGAPTPQHDIYTIGRTLAVLTADFRFGTDFRQTLPPAASIPAWATQAAFYRLMDKATRLNPDDRFQTAADLEDQLRGVLRLVVAETEPVPVVESTVFSGDVLEFAGTEVDEPGWRSLPVTRTLPADPATPVIEAANRERDQDARSTILRRALEQPQFQQSPDLPLQLSAALIERGDFAEAEQLLEQLEAADPFNWRVAWVRGKLRLAQHRAHEARALFDGVDAELPGELAPKLATAVAAELDGDHAAAASLYDRVSQTDRSYTTAIFGLARCRLRLGDRDGAVAAYQRVPANSSRYIDAQLAQARALVESPAGQPTLDDLVRASDILGALTSPGVAERAEVQMVAASLFLKAADQVDHGVRPPDGTRVLGRACTVAELRRGAEERLRRSARHARSDAERIELIDRANAIRPWSLA